MTKKQLIEYIRKEVSKLINEGFSLTQEPSLRTAQVFRKPINRRVKLNYYSKQGKVEGIDEFSIILAIGDEDYCESIKQKLESKESSQFLYNVYPSKFYKGEYIVVAHWLYSR